MKRWFWLLIGLLLIVSLACGLLPGRDRGGDTPPEAAVTAVVVQEGDPDTETEVPADPSGDDDALVVDRDALDQISSYRATITWRSESGDGTVETFTMHQSATRNPAAQRMVIDSDDGDMEFIQIGNETWVRFGDEWMQSGSDTESDFGDMLSGGDDWIFNVSDSGYEYLGRATVNGVNTRHYRVKYTEGFLGWFGADDDVERITDGSAEVWIADERGLPRFTVKSEVQMTGTSDGETITIVMTQSVSDINQPITIEAPEGVGGLPDGLPIYPGATDVTSMTSFTMFTAPDDVATVNEFYQEALTGAGWVEVGEGMVLDEMVSSSWDKDGRTLSLMISDDDGSSSVMISVED
jgi:hypothetical protein